MVFENDCAEIITRQFPEFVASYEWEEHLLFWKDSEEKYNLCGIFSTFSSFTKRLLNTEPTPPFLVKIFNFIETMMREGDQLVGDCAATCFLENLINLVGHGSVQASTFIPLLGPESREYCKAWDKFTGVQTPGLWKSKWEWWFYK
jgi:hypothetical protein